MQEQLNNIEELVQEEPELEEVSTSFKLSQDTESIQEELEVGYKKLKSKEPKNILEKTRQTIGKYFSLNNETPISEQRRDYVVDLGRIAKDCKKALADGGKAKKKVHDLEERISSSLLIDKNNFLKLQDYATKLEDAANYTQEQLDSENSLEEESVLRSQLNQLEEKKNNTYSQLDQISIRIQQTSVQRRQSREYLQYAEMQSYRIQQTLQTAEYTIAFLDASDGLSEYLRAGGLAAELHGLFDRSDVLTGETDDLLVGALKALGELDFPEGSEISLETANKEATNKLHKERTQRIGKAREIIDAI